MGAQSILEKDICSLRSDYTDRLLEYAEKRILQLNYDVGTICKDEMVEDLLTYRVLYSKNCDVLYHVDKNMVYENMLLPKGNKDCSCQGKKRTGETTVFSSEFSTDFQ